MTHGKRRPLGTDDDLCSQGSGGLLGGRGHRELPGPGSDPPRAGTALPGGDHTYGNLQTAEFRAKDTQVTE